jgi:hypothetical protein
MISWKPKLPGRKVSATEVGCFLGTASLSLVHVVHSVVLIASADADSASPSEDAFAEQAPSHLADLTSPDAVPVP